MNVVKGELKKLLERIRNGADKSGGVDAMQYNLARRAIRLILISVTVAAVAVYGQTIPGTKTYIDPTTGMQRVISSDDAPPPAGRIEGHAGPTAASMGTYQTWQDPGEGALYRGRDSGVLQGQDSAF